MLYTLISVTFHALNEIARIHVEGFTEEPQVHYCYQLRHQFPDDHWKWTRRENEDFLEQPEKFEVHVLEAPSEIDGDVVHKPVGHAVWNIAVLTKAMEEGITHPPNDSTPSFTNL